jgi:hypothetical protein
MGEEYRTVGILQADPDNCEQWILIVLEFGIIPICLGLSLYSICLKLRKMPFKRNGSLLLLIFGGFLAILEIWYCLTTYSSYREATGLANQWNVKGIDGSLQIIYIGSGFVGFLWIVSGVLISDTGYFRRPS